LMAGEAWSLSQLTGTLWELGSSGVKNSLLDL
jgi:hypothetical protein